MRQRSRFLDPLVGPASPSGRRAPGDRRGGRSLETRRVVELGDAFASQNTGDDTEEALFQALRGLRTRRAKDDGMPPYVIAHDSTLTAIAAARPGTLAALRRVPGMGPTKLDRYGDEILAVIEEATP
jgi:superfamily II DNA helicase RecQ